MIQRWITFDREWHKSDHGDWVQWDDVQALQRMTNNLAFALTEACRLIEGVPPSQFGTTREGWLLSVSNLLKDFDADVRQDNDRLLRALASAMRKMLPPPLLQDVVDRLDPLTPFVKYLREEAPK